MLAHHVGVLALVEGVVVGVPGPRLREPAAVQLVQQRGDALSTWKPSTSNGSSSASCWTVLRVAGPAFPNYARPSTPRAKARAGAVARDFRGEARAPSREEDHFMLVRTMEQIEAEGRIVSISHGKSSALRLITKSDGVGFSVSEARAPGPASSDLWYKHHWEANYVRSGRGVLEDRGKWREVGVRARGPVLRRPEGPASRNANGRRGPAHHQRLQPAPGRRGDP